MNLQITIIIIITDIYMAWIRKMQQKHQVNCYSPQLLSWRMFSAAYEIQTVTCLVEVQLADCSIQSDRQQRSCNHHSSSSCVEQRVVQIRQSEGDTCATLSEIHKWSNAIKYLLKVPFQSNSNSNSHDKVYGAAMVAVQRVHPVHLTNVAFSARWLPTFGPSW